MEGARPGGKRSRKNKHVAPKKLGRKAQAGIYHNDKAVEDYLEAVEAGAPVFFEVGVAEANPRSAHPGAFDFGDGSFSIRLEEGYVRAILIGYVRTPGRVHKKEGVAQAVNNGSVVLVEPMAFRVGASSHRIVGVPSPDQLARMVRRLSSSARSSSNMFTRKRRSSSISREAAARRAEMEALPFVVAATRRATATAGPALD
jgi:hypothetical protein